MQRRSLLIGAVVVLVALVGGVLAVVGLGGGAESAAGEVFLEPVQSSGTDPFFGETDELVAVAPVNLPRREPALPRPDDEAKATQPIPGATPGLYGGTKDNSRCNRLQLVEFLESNPDKAQAWAGAQGIAADQIREFVDTLTPSVLLKDTRVTNHGFKDGRANPIQSVLQAGTAVLIDDSGMPRARCACGNPLLRPIPQTTVVRYSGPEWTGFDPGDLRVVSPGPGTDQFVLQDLDGGPAFARPTGSDGKDDFPAPPAAIDAIPHIVLVPELGDPAKTEPVGGPANGGAVVPEATIPPESADAPIDGGELLDGGLDALDGPLDGGGMDDDAYCDTYRAYAESNVDLDQAGIEAGYREMASYSDGEIGAIWQWAVDNADRIWDADEGVQGQIDTFNEVLRSDTPTRCDGFDPFS